MDTENNVHETIKELKQSIKVIGQALRTVEKGLEHHIEYHEREDAQTQDND